MTRVVIAPTFPEYGIAGDDYEALAAALREQGYDARVERPDDRVEFRHLPPDVVQTAHDVAIFVGDQLAGEALEALVTLVVMRLRRKTKRARLVLIYGSRGEVLRRVELPPSNE